MADVTLIDKTPWDMISDLLLDPVFWATFFVGTFVIAFYVRIIRKRRMC
jgi:hypothetical protein